MSSLGQNLKANNPTESKEDEILDSTLRPRKWDEYIGQEKIKKNIRIIIEAAKKRKEAPEHILLYGNSGLGKTSLAYLIGREIGADVRISAGPSIEKPGDLAALLTNLSERDILFIDECHRLNKVCEEILYPAMEDYKLHLVLGKGPMARTMDLDLPRFTIIGATTHLGMLSAPLRNRFGAIFQLDFYKVEEIMKIIFRSARILNIKIEEEAAELIARSSRLTPRVANRLLKRVRDFAQVEGREVITKEIVQKTFDFLEIDEIGLEQGDRKIIETIITKFNGGPVGLKTLAAATSEEESTILDIYEPYLLQIGFIERTIKGRCATPLAYKHLGFKIKSSQKKLLS